MLSVLYGQIYLPKPLIMSDLSPLLDTLCKPHLVHQDIQPLIDACAKIEGIKVVEAGKSFEQRSISLISMGNGPIVVFAWTQMHGNEATATAAVFDLIDILVDAKGYTTCIEHQSATSQWQKQFTLHILPMLNPDGAQRCIRQNAQGIDINRDAQAQQSPEGRLLMQLVDKLKPDIGFNLHDQSPYYQCGKTGNPATIAFLAPAFDYEKTIDKSRLRAMQLIVHMNEGLQQSIADCVARYDDTYSPRSFGDNIAGKKVSTILIESGAAVNDPNRQLARKYNVESMLSAMDWLLQSPANSESQLAKDQTLQDYFRIPENISEALSSLVLRNLSFCNSRSNAYLVGISIKQSARYSDNFYIDFIGDLGIQAGLQDIDCEGMQFKRGECYPDSLPSTFSNADYKRILKQGYICFNAIEKDSIKEFTNKSGWPMLWTDAPCLNIHSDAALTLNDPAYLLLEKEGQVVAVVLNGRYISLD